MKMDIRIGTGFDVHRLVADRPLWLGGVQIPFNKGCLAHSDGDVLLHAVCDAMLGALAMGDIGIHFPDTDLKYKNIRSLNLLERTYQLVREKGFRLGNLDATLILQKPKVAPFVLEMRRNIAKVLNAGIEDVSIKATTTEGLGFTGKGEGVAVQAVVLLERIDSPIIG